MSNQPATEPKLLDRVREVIRIKHYSIRTEQAYLQWIRRFILFHGKQHPRFLGADALTAFLSDLAIRGKVAAATQNQALNAILFMYREVLKIQLPWLDDVQRAKRPHRLPVVLTRDEVRGILAQLDGTVWLMAGIIYGGGLRLLECLRLRVKDLDLDRGELTIRDAKGQKDRITMLPRTLIEPLRTHLARVRHLHETDVAAGYGRVYLPFALDRKYPNADLGGAGSMFSPLRGVPSIRALKSNAVITRVLRHYNEQLRMRCAKHKSSSQQACIRCATRLPRTCSNQVTTFALSRSCSVTAT